MLFFFFKKSPKNLNKLKQQTVNGIKNLTTLRELSRILRQIEAVYLQARNIGIKSEYNKMVEENLKKLYMTLTPQIFNFIPSITDFI
ncbi:hypothetical protein IM40_04825 [Candidatus Paracaedimonas acanthamoebae]|nr:hypothetical protein IM40_04825 [Candidatus Paracaedimonas acanthamoebae]